jgi:class 3 adenylate cyclase
LQNVYQAKAVVIAAVIDVCRMYGGHLHDIPGDGVLFFFGGKEQESLDAAMRAVQAACDGMVFLESDIIHEFNSEESYPDIYPKMGIDYGTVLWGAYGCDHCYETKATGFNVDIASKMMRQCNAKDIAIGDDLRTFLELPEDYLTRGWKYDRSLTIGGEERTVSYQTWLLDWRSFGRQEMNTNSGLEQLGALGPIPRVVTSKSKLGDAPLA